MRGGSTALTELRCLKCPRVLGETNTTGLCYVCNKRLLQCAYLPQWKVKERERKKALRPKCVQCHKPLHTNNSSRTHCNLCKAETKAKKPSRVKRNAGDIERGPGRKEYVQPVCLTPCAPTSTLPGSPERFAVMQARAAAGQELTHPKDATHETAFVGVKQIVCEYDRKGREPDDSDHDEDAA